MYGMPVTITDTPSGPQLLPGGTRDAMARGPKGGEIEISIHRGLVYLWDLGKYRTYRCEHLGEKLRSEKYLLVQRHA